MPGRLPVSAGDCPDASVFRGIARWQCIRNEPSPAQMTQPRSTASATLRPASALMYVSGTFRAKVCKSCIHAVSEQGSNAAGPVRSRLSREGRRATAGPRLSERAQQKNRHQDGRDSCVRRSGAAGAQDACGPRRHPAAWRAARAQERRPGPAAAGTTRTAIGLRQCGQASMATSEPPGSRPSSSTGSGAGRTAWSRDDAC
jgi:hypothetical protein